MTPPQKKSKVLVGGATGYLGSHVAAELLERGHQVRCLVRDPEKARRVGLTCDDLFVADATDAVSLKGVCKDIDVVISSIGLRTYRAHPTLEQVDYAANMNLIKQAKLSGVKHFIFVSILKGDKLRSKNKLMNARERVGDALKVSGMRYTIARPTGFFNDMAGIFHMAVAGKFMLIGKGEIKFNPIHGADLAHELVASINDKNRWDTGFDIGGPNVYSLKEVGELAFAMLGQEPAYTSIPTWFIKLSATLVLPFNGNVAAILQAMAMLGEDADLTAPPYGTHKLSDFYKKLALEHKSKIQRQDS